MTSLEQVAQEIMDRYKVTASIDDQRPLNYMAVIDIKTLKANYRRFLPTDGVPDNIIALIQGANDKQLREYFLHGPYGEYLTIASPSNDFEFSASRFVDETEDPYAQGSTLILSSLKADAYFQALKESKNLLTKEFCNEWNKREANSPADQNTKYVIRTDYPFAFYCLARGFLDDLQALAK